MENIDVYICTVHSYCINNPVQWLRIYLYFGREHYFLTEISENYAYFLLVALGVKIKISLHFSVCQEVA